MEGSREIPIGERRIGMPLLWSPNEEEERLLRQDWEELMDMIVLGEVEQISARHGQVLQLRPKAANNKALTRAIEQWPADHDPAARLLPQDRLYPRAAAAPLCPARLISVINILVIK